MKLREQPQRQDEALQAKRERAYNSQAHRLYRESRGAFGWPDHEWHGLPEGPISQGRELPVLTPVKERMEPRLSTD